MSGRRFLLLDHLNVISVDHLWRFWPVILMAVGAAHMAEPGRRPWGGVVLVVGTLFLLSSLNILHVNWAELWPLAIIIAGGMMIWNSLEAQRRRTDIPDSASTMNALRNFQRCRASRHRKGLSLRPNQRGFRRRRTGFS